MNRHHETAGMQAIPPHVMRTSNVFNHCRKWPHIPAPGQLWRIQAGGTALPVLVVEMFDDDEAMSVVVAGEDPEYADAATVVVDEADSTLGFGYGIWVSVEHVVPGIVADRCLGPVTRHVWHDADTSRRALRDRFELSGSGSRISSPLDPRIAYRAELERHLLDVVAATR